MSKEYDGIDDQDMFGDMARVKFGDHVIIVDSTDGMEYGQDSTYRIRVDGKTLDESWSVDQLSDLAAVVRSGGGDIKLFREFYKEKHDYVSGRLEQAKDAEDDQNIRHFEYIIDDFEGYVSDQYTEYVIERLTKFFVRHAYSRSH